MVVTSRRVKKYACLAIDCLKAVRQKHAFDASRFRIGISHDPHAERSHRRYAELTEAIQYYERVKAGVFDGQA